MVFIRIKAHEDSVPCTSPWGMPPEHAALPLPSIGLQSRYVSCIDVFVRFICHNVCLCFIVFVILVVMCCRLSVCSSLKHLTSLGETGSDLPYHVPLHNVLLFICRLYGLCYVVNCVLCVLCAYHVPLHMLYVCMVWVRFDMSWCWVRRCAAACYMVLHDVAWYVVLRLWCAHTRTHYIHLSIYYIYIYSIYSACGMHV